MKNRDLQDVNFDAAMVASYARKVAMRLNRAHPQIAAKFLKMSEFAQNLATYVDIHEELPPQLPVSAEVKARFRLPTGE